jgi:hypothetical protein
MTAQASGLTLHQDTLSSLDGIQHTFGDQELQRQIVLTDGTQPAPLVSVPELALEAPADRRTSSLAGSLPRRSLEASQPT